MAYINDIFVFVVSESYGQTITPSDHPVESGVDMTDHVKPQAKTLNITGEIVGENAEEVRNVLTSYQESGMIITYAGRRIFPQAQIISFESGYSVSIVGGYSFTMQIRQVRIARSAYHADNYDGTLKIGVWQQDGTQQIVRLAERQERYHTLMVGESLLYLSRQYQNYGVTIESIKALNVGRPVFATGHQGDFNYLRADARLLLGVW